MIKKLKSFIHRKRFTLHIWVLLLPIYFLYQSLTPEFPPAWESKQISGFEFTPMPYDLNPPYSHHGVYVKDFLLMVKKGDIKEIRQAYLNIGPSALAFETMQSEDEGIVHGTQHGLHAHALSNSRVDKEDKLWLTLEDWRGQVYITSWDFPE